MDTKKNKKKDNSVARAFVLVSQLGLSMAGCVVVGLFIGIYLDRWLGTSPWMMVVFLFIGAGAAVKLIYDLAKDWK